MSILSERPIFFLNLHGIGQPSRAYEPGEENYWISVSDFARLLDFVLHQQHMTDIRMTFDDGNLSDYMIAAPELRKRCLGAGFFILAGNIGKPGYLCESQIRQLSNDGFEIGLHGLTHIPWIRLRTTDLRRELDEARVILESITGRPVKSISFPFGAYNRRVIRELEKCGYRHLYSSDGGIRLTSGRTIPRFTVKRDADVRSISNMMCTAGNLTERIKTEIRVWAKEYLR